MEFYENIQTASNSFILLSNSDLSEFGNEADDEGEATKLNLSRAHFKCASSIIDTM